MTYKTSYNKRYIQCPRCNAIFTIYNEVDVERIDNYEIQYFSDNQTHVSNCPYCHKGIDKED